MKLKEGIYYNATLDQLIIVENIIPLDPGYLILFELPFGKSEALFKNIDIKDTEHIIYLGKD